MRYEAESFAERAQLSEWMDEPCSYEEFRECLRDLVRANRTLLAYRPTLKWLGRLAARTSEPLHIVDVGCGAGDMLERIERWARKKKIAVKLTGIDISPHATRAARELARAGSQIEWHTGEAYDYRPQENIDVIVSSQFTHHLSDAEVVRFLRWMEQTAKRGWFISDLHRTRHAYLGFRVLATVMRLHRFVRHDGPISIRRSFSRLDWMRLLEQAGLAGEAITIEDAWPGRLCVARVKT
jgi:2-polyprenyl-3-methyl-5-hydroxy-6-metoxy-1,4-benzoquinol methylase